MGPLNDTPSGATSRCAADPGVETRIRARAGMGAGQDSMAACSGQSRRGRGERCNTARPPRDLGRRPTLCQPDDPAASKRSPLTRIATIRWLWSMSGSPIGRHSRATAKLAKLAGARVIGTASESTFEFLRQLGTEPVEYGPGLADRVRALVPGGVTAGDGPFRHRNGRGGVGAWHPARANLHHRRRTEPSRRRARNRRCRGRCMGTSRPRPSSRQRAPLGLGTRSSEACVTSWATSACTAARSSRSATPNGPICARSVRRSRSW